MSETNNPIEIIEMDGLPKVYVHCKQTYELMLKNKSSNVYEGKPVYRGHLTKEMEEELGLTTAQYSRVINMLKEMNCIVQLKRGAGSVPSEWVLIDAPDFDAFKVIKGEKLDRMHKQKAPVDQRLKELIEIINDLEVRIEHLETEVFTDG